MRLLSFIAIFFGISNTALAADDSDIELLNSTLITKLHLDPTANRGQMVGAYQVSFRNTTNAPLSRVSLLLNPSLSFVKATGSGGAMLAISSDVTAVAGYELLELNVANVRLPEPLGADKRTEIVIHYKGYLTNMTYMAIDGVKETLNPDFTMIRADSFGYPVFAEPKRSSVDAAFAHKPFQQVAFIEYPGSNDIAGSLGVADKTQSGGKTKVEMKSNAATGLFAAAIAPYSHLEAGPVRVSYLTGGMASAQNFLSLAAREAARIENLLGRPSGTAELRFIELPAGYGSSPAKGAYFSESSFFDTSSIAPDIKNAILDLWKSSGGGTPGHWSNGLDAFVQIAISTPENIATFQQSNFTASQQLFSTDKRMGKTSLADYTIEGYSDQSDTVNALAYSTLYALLGPEAFFNFVKSLRVETRGQYVDAEQVADFMKRNIKDKAAKKFVKNWFSSGRAGKDMAKAKSFEDLLKRYE